MPSIPKKKGEPIPKVHRWYENEKYDYKKYAELKGKVVSYFKVQQIRYGRNGRALEKYYKVHESGFMVYVDATMFKIGVAQGITTPSLMLNSNKREFETAFKKVSNLLK